MNDLSLIIIYSLCVLSTVYAIGLALRRDSGKHLTKYVLFFAFMVLGWQVVQLFFHGSRSFERSRFLFDIDLPFVALSSMGILLFALRLFSFRITPGTVLLLCIIPGITTVLALAYNHNTFLRASLEITAVWPMHTADFVRGIWFWVHAAYCYGVVMAASGIALAQYRRIPKVYRAAAQQLILSIVISLIGNILVLTALFSVELDFSLLGATIAIYPLYFSTRNNQGLEFLNGAKEGIFNEIDEGILIVDDADCIIDYNATAGRHIDTLALDGGDGTYAALTDRMIARATRFEQVEKEGGGIDYYFELPGGVRQVLNIQEKPLTDRRGHLLTRFVICRDVTENRATIQRLAAEAGMDALTGLMNRGMIADVTRTIDTEESLPIAAIMGDLNYLKKVNDVMGHQQGDLYLLKAAEILSACCPPNARIGRIGGDEFVALIPHCAQKQAERVIRAIDERFSALSGYAFPVSMSLGTCVKTSTAQPMEEIIKQADARMYMDKRQRKAARA